MGQICFSKEMGLTHADFFRLLPRAMGDYGYEIDGSTVRATVHAGTVEIVLGPQKTRQIALLRLPYAVVSFTFKDVSEAQQLAFTEHFDLHFRRGGG